MPIELAQVIEARRGSEEPDALGVPRTLRRPRRRRTRRGRPKTIRPIKVRPIDEIEYRNQLLLLVARLQAQVESVLFPLIDQLESEFMRDGKRRQYDAEGKRKRPGYDGHEDDDEPDDDAPPSDHLAPEFAPTGTPRLGNVLVHDDPARDPTAVAVRDDFSEDLDRAFKGLRQQQEDLEEFAVSRAERMVTGVDRAHEIRYMRQLQLKVGIDARGLIQSEQLEATLRATTRVNVNLIESIPAEYFQKIEKLVFQNTLEGRTSAASLREAIEEIGESTESRARLIARDQTAKLNSAVNEERNTALGIVEYIWRATGGKSGDGRTRDRHRAAHGNVYRFDDPKVIGVTGRKVNPGQDIQCVPGSAKIDLANGCHKLWRRLYNGPLVTVVTADGVLLEATPNHPVVTSRGWLPIDDLQEGDYLVHAVIDRTLIDEANGHELVSSFEDLFDAAAISQALISTPGTRLDFHGDGRECDVDVVTIDRELWSNLDASASERFGKLDFTDSDSTAASQPDIADCFSAPGVPVSVLDVARSPDALMGSGRERLPLGSGELGHADEVGRGSTSAESLAAENSIDDAPRDIESPRESQDAIPGFESIDDLTLRKIVAAVRCLGDEISTVVEVGEVTAETIAESVRAAAEDGSGLFKIGTVHYQLTRVIEKFSTEFSGHVYNLQCDKGFYSSNGIIIHNCRCTAEAIIPGF